MGAGKALDIHTDDWNNRGGIAQKRNGRHGNGG